MQHRSDIRAVILPLESPDGREALIAAAAALRTGEEELQASRCDDPRFNFEASDRLIWESWALSDRLDRGLLSAEVPLGIANPVRDHLAGRLHVAAKALIEDTSTLPLTAHIEHVYSLAVILRALNAAQQSLLPA